MSRAILQKIALERGGRCLWERYINSKTKYEWECLAGHRWFAPFDKVKHRNQWCPVCYKNRSFEKLRSIVEERGGKVLSEGMDTVRSTLSVLCNKLCKSPCQFVDLLIFIYEYFLQVQKLQMPQA